MLHACDPRRKQGPFVPLNCSALSKNLAESELFGHRRGAFSGALDDRVGLVRSADQGVLFLDEIAELDWDLQAKLLRVVQEGRVLPVGCDRETSVDVRVVAATHRDLGSLVSQGRFREDLFYRLSVVSVKLPPLRERREDIPDLVRHFASKHAGLTQGSPRAAAEDCLGALRRLRFPGNVRELENLVRSALSTIDHDGPIPLCNLPRETLEELAAPASTEAEESATEPAGAPIDWSLSRAVRRAEHRALQAEGDQSLKGTKYVWLTSPENWRKEQRVVFRALRGDNLKVGRAFAIKEQFRGFWNYTYAGAARTFYKSWHFWATHSRLKPIRDAAMTLWRHQPGLFAYFRHRISNAVAEGLNSKIQMIKSGARGFRNFQNYRTAILFHCGGLKMRPHKCR
jgi:transcriptional regulator with GAF, ATPase, and Fis domain